MSLPWQWSGRGSQAKPFNIHSLHSVHASRALPCVVLRCDFPGLAVLAQSPEEPGEWLVCQGSCGWPAVREITVTMLLSWLCPSLEGLKQHSRFPQLSISLPVQEGAGTHLNFVPPPPFAAAWAKIQVCSSIILCPKSSGSFPKC